MSSLNPNYGPLIPLPGNKGVLGLVDYGISTVGVRNRLWVLLSRNYNVLTEGKVFFLTGCSQVGLELVPGSTKFGIELLRPRWVFTYTGFQTPVSQASCFLRLDLLPPVPAWAFQPMLVALYHGGLVIPGDGLPLGPVITLADRAGHAPSRLSCSF